jgi:hypothetical protein
MSDWTVRLRVEPSAVKLLVNNEEGDLLKARLPVCPRHPRALLTLVEGLALWAGSPLTAAIGVGAHWDRTRATDLFGAPGWPIDSALVRFEEVAAPPRRRRRHIAGVGDFRELHQLRLWGGAR